MRKRRIIALTICVVKYLQNWSKAALALALGPKKAIALSHIQTDLLKQIFWDLGTLKFILSLNSI